MEKTQIASVRLLSTTWQNDRVFDYLCPAFIPVRRGAVVKFPFGRQNKESWGIVVGVRRDTPSRPLKAITAAEPSELWLGEELMELCSYLVEQLFCTFGEAARAMLPSSVYRKKEKTLRFASLCEGVDPQKALENFRGKKRDQYLSLLSHLSLAGKCAVKNLEELFPGCAPSLSFLQKKGLIEFEYLSEERNPYKELFDFSEKDRENELSEEQRQAFLTLRDRLDEGKPCGALLYGVTGSGKTRVMLSLCDHVLSKGKSVLFLVPEIALTSQSAKMLMARYGDSVAVIHSALSEGERRDAYLAVSRGEKRIVLGTRSAVFAPLSDIGLILIDEEQDPSYKSDTNLKFHARDVARWRCAKNGAMLLLASATPDIETFYKAKNGKYDLVTLKNRYGTAQLPEVCIVDLRHDLRKNPSQLVGKRLREEIRRNLDKGEQTILLMNRRGYRRFVSCLSCGEAIRCPNCSVTLTMHNGRQKYLSCHYCGYTIPYPEKCPACGEDHLITHGSGIQMLEEELNTLFPGAKILRMDSDTTSQKLSHEKLLRSFQNGEADILIGTQMVAKGHNFPQVTLVGIVMADTALYLSDYRAGESCFSLLTQVIGRAGRALLPGRAIIQTLNPRHNVFSMAASQDYENFYNGEIALRKSFLFPPFCEMGVLTLSDEDEKRLLLASKNCADLLQSALQKDFKDVKLIIYGPFEASIYKCKNIYRKRFIFKYKNNRRTRELFALLLKESAADGKTKVSLDLHPGMI